MTLRRLIICLGILIWGSACEQVSNPIPKAFVEEETKKLEIKTQFGEPIPSGIAFKRKGQIVPLAKLPKPQEIDIDPVLTLQYQAPQKMPLSLVRTLPYPKGDTIYFGKNGIPYPDKVSINVKKIIARRPEAKKAAPFFRKDKTRGPFDYLSIQQGLPSNYVNYLTKDKNGFIWISNSVGLTRYDGKTFRHYDANSNFYDAGSILSDNQIGALTLDSIGHLWISTDYGRNTMRFDGNFFYKYKTQKGDNFSFSNLHIDQHNNYWFSAKTKWYDSPLLKYDGHKFIAYDKRHGFNGSYRTQWFKNKSGEDIFSHQNILSKFKDSTYVIHYIFDSLRKPYPYVDQNKTIHFFPDQQICRVEGEQINCFTAPILRQDKIQKVTFDENRKLLIKHHSGAVSYLQDNFLFYIAKEDLPAYKFNTELKGEIIDQHYWYSSGQQGEGIERFKPNTFQLVDWDGLSYRKQEAITSEIFEDSKKNLWFGLHGGGLVKKEQHSYFFFQDQGAYFRGKIIRSIFEDQENNIWIGAGHQLIKYDGKDFFYYDLRDYFTHKNSTITSIHDDPKGNLWLGTNASGFCKFDGQQFTFYINDYEKNITSFKTSNNIKIIESDKNGDLWIGTLGGGLIHFKTEAETFTYYTRKEGLCSNHIVSLYEDSRGTIWVGSNDNGISKVVNDAGEISFQNFNQKDGLSQNDVWTINEDPKGNLWLGVDACLNLLFFENKEQRNKIVSVTEYCDFNGQSSHEFFSNACLLDSENQMWWGSTGNLLKVDANSIMPRTDAPKVFLDQIEINQEAVDFTEVDQAKMTYSDFWIDTNKDQNLATIQYSTIAPYFNYPLGLKLPHYFNTITFHFAATNDPVLSDVKFSYFLEGNDRQWSKPSLEHKVDYRNLSPGNYTFKVKAAGKNAVWSKPFEYSFSIAPPWWRTWLAYLFYFVILASGIYWFYQFNLNRRLDQAETKRVKELNTLKTRLYTNITHEFRTPLTVIMGMNENIQDNEKEKKLIRRNSKNLLRLVNQLLDLSKLESGTMKMDQVQGDIIIYLQFLTESFYSMAEEKNVRLTFYSEVDELVMDYDEVKIQHIIYNLVSNAIKFTPSGGKVILHLNKESEAGYSQLKLKVKDTGIGIAKDKIPHIFDRFYQVDGSHTRKGEGTGIGLALTKELVEMMEGTIEVKSIEDRGTEFIIFLPIHNQATKLDIKNYSSDFFDEKAKELVPIISNERQLDIPVADEHFKAEVLIIEDNHDVAVYIESLLRTEYKVHIAADGQKGIDAAIELIPDIIISDVMMPEKDGYEVCNTLKQDTRTSHIPIILLTAKAEQADKIQGLQYGADAFLVKPFDKTELLIRINKLIEIRKHLQEKYNDITLENASSLKASNQVKVKNTIDDKFIQEIKDVVENNYGNADFGVNELAKAMFMSHTQVYRKIKALTGKTPSQFIRSIRLQKGKVLLSSPELNISEIAYEIGFTDPSYFSRTFQKEFGISPRDFRQGSR